MDPTSETDELLSQRDFLRRLARGLLGDEALAEDVVQEAELRALEHRPAGNLRAWLATVTRRLALNAHRGRGRRSAHERAAARAEAVPGPDEVLEGLDLQRGVLEAVRALAEAQRTVVWLRYYEDRSPDEIAARLALPVATVKTRLRRALAALRERLDAAHGGERRAWAAALVLLARAGSGLAGMDAGLMLGGVLAMKKVVVGFAVLVLAWLGWRVWRAELEPRAAGRMEQQTAELAVGGEPSVLTDAVAGAEGRVEFQGSPEGAHEAALAAATLAVHVAHERDGADAPGVGLVLWPLEDALAELHALELETDALGRARFEGVAPGRYSVHTDRDGETPLELAVGEERELELVLPSGFDVAGVVVDGEGQPVAGAEVWLEGRGAGSRGGRIVARAGLDGRFRLRSLGEEQALSAFAPGFAPAFLERLHTKELPEGQAELAVTLVLGREGRELGGLVVDPQGGAVSGARVALGTKGNAVTGQVDGSEGWRPRARMLVTDEGGGFRAGWLDVGSAAHLSDRLVHVLAPGFALARAEWDGTSSEFRVPLELGTTIEGVVRDAEGRPVAGASISVLAAGAIEFSGSPFELPSTHTATDGTYRLEHVPSGTVEVAAGLRAEPRRGAQETRECDDAELVRWDLTLATARVITGRVVDEQGAGLAGKPVLVSNDSGMSGVSSDARGGFVFTPFATGEEVADEEWSFALMGAGGVLDRAEHVRLGAEIVLVAHAHQAGVRGGFHDRAGRARPGERVLATLHARDALQMSFGAELDPQGAFAFGEVVPGRYRVTIESGEVSIAHSPWFDVEEGQALDLDWLETRAPGSIALACALPPGVVLESVEATLYELEGYGAVGLRPCAGGLCATSLEPGSYRLEVGGAGLALLQQELEIPTGSELRLALDLQAGVERRLVFVAPADVRVSRLSVVVRDLASGRELVHESPNVIAGRRLSARFGLAPGSYAFEAKTDVGLTAQGTLEISDLAAGEAELTFELR